MRARLLNSYSLAADYGRKLLADVDADQMVAQPVVGMNHPAWIVGHLVYSCQMIGIEMGLTAWLPSDWVRRFATGSAVTADIAAYPTKAELLAAFDDATSRIRQRLERMTDAALDGPLPDERHRHVFPTLGHAALHILTVHLAVHLGQLSAWRRVMGLADL